MCDAIASILPAHNNGSTEHSSNSLLQSCKEELNHTRCYRPATIKPTWDALNPSLLMLVLKNCQASSCVLAAHITSSTEIIVLCDQRKLANWLGHCTAHVLFQKMAMSLVVRKSSASVFNFSSTRCPLSE